MAHLARRIYWHCSLNIILPPVRYQTSFSKSREMTSIYPPPRALLKPRHVDANEQNTSRDLSNGHTRVERWQHNHFDRLWMNRLLSVFFAPEPSLPVFHESYIQSFSFAEIDPNPLAPSGAGSYSSGRKLLTASTGNRNRRRIHHESVKQTSAGSQPSIIPKGSHESRKSDLGKALEPMLGDDRSATILLCWGAKHHCHIFPVNIENPTDEVAVWQEIHWAWYCYRGHWRRYLPFFGVREVDIVKVCHVTIQRAVCLIVY